MSDGVPVPSGLRVSTSCLLLQIFRKNSVYLGKKLSLSDVFLRFRGKTAQALHFDTLPVRPLENRVFPSVGQDPRFFEDGNRSGS